jgi:hypothetical protein
MTFLAPVLLFALPLAALPVIIHLIHLHRRRTVKWAAMMFLLAAQKMNKGLSRLRQILILALRVLALMALIFVISRPLAGGLLGLTGGAPDTVIVLLDRSASMEQQNLNTGTSKRASGLQKLSAAIRDTVGTRSRLVLIDSALGLTQEIEKPEALADLPSSGPTETAADVPALMQAALDHITRNKTGRTDVCLLSDLQQSDWDASGGRWESLRAAFASLQGVRFNLLCYSQPAKENLGVTVERVVRREGAEKAELLLDLRVIGDPPGDVTAGLPLRFVINGVASTHKAEMKERQLVLQAHAIPIDKATKRGWGRVELPTDSFAPDNVFHFVFDEPPVLKSVIVSDDEAEVSSLVAVLSAPSDPARKFAASVLPASRAAEIPWDEAALIVWHAPIPTAEDVIGKQLEAQVRAGRTVIFLPPANVTKDAFMGLQWGAWKSGGVSDSAPTIEWWRNDSGLLANTRDGAALPLGDLEITRQCEIIGEGTPFARTQGNQPLLVRATGDQSSGAYFLGTLPGSSASSLARDGVVLFAMMHRALQDGARSLGKARQQLASKNALTADADAWKRVDEKDGTTILSSELPLRAGVLEAGEKLISLNRPTTEDEPAALSRSTVEELFTGLDHQILEDTLETEKSLASEIWRTFLIAMALALLGEALLCMPARRTEAAAV